MNKNKKLPLKVIGIIVLTGLGLPILLYYIYFEWEMKQFRESLQSFDETEFLKTHYQGVDCSSLVGRVTFGDYGISAQEACVGERAWYEGNIELCNHINGCMAWIAVKTGDLEICKQLEPERAPSMEDKLIGNKRQNVSQHGCEQGVAIYRDMPKICDSIPYSDESYKQECKEKATDGKTYLQFENSPMRPYCLEYNSDGICVW